MAQAKEQSQTMAQAQNRNTESTGEKRPRTRRPYYQRRPRRPQQPKEAAVPIHIYPLGGLGEVGKNMTVYECCGDMIIVDCGLVFPDSDMYGVDLVIPDFTFVVQNKEKIKGLLITHGHEDHIGSIPYLLQKFDLPIYGTRLTCGLIRNKLEEFGLAGKTKFVEITPKQKLKLGCFTVEPIHVNHSIPDAVAFAIDSPAGTIIQTGDFKIDYTPLACGVTDLTTLSEYGQKGVLALLSDSPNAERPGFTATEQKVAAGVRNLFARARHKRENAGQQKHRNRRFLGNGKHAGKDGKRNDRQQGGRGGVCAQQGKQFVPQPAHSAHQCAVRQAAPGARKQNGKAQRARRGQKKLRGQLAAVK